MRSELNELALIDNYLLHQLDAEETRNVEISILSNDAFAQKVEAQRIAHRLIRLYSHKARLEKIHAYLLTDQNFADQLKNIFA